MLKIKTENSFKKDIKRNQKSGNYSKNDFENLKKVIENLQKQLEIDLKYKRHPLKGDMKNLEVAHIKPDWLLVFKVNSEYLNLIMLGKHTQVYKKFK